jgi:hypothetical protein
MVAEKQEEFKEFGREVRSQEGLGSGERSTGGEPLWNPPKDLAIFFPLRGRPKYRVKQAAPGELPHEVFGLAFRSEIVHFA